MFHSRAISLVKLTRNAAGQIVSRTRSNPSYAWFRSDTTPQQPYDVDRSSPTNALNQTTASGTFPLSWNAMGALGADGTGKIYGYDTGCVGTCTTGRR